MNKELQEKLVKTYPNIFRDIGGDPMKTCMAWGIECGDGWYPIIDSLCSVIKNTVENVKQRWSDKVPDLLFDVRAAQVKEKYGSMRFYIDIDIDTREDLDDRLKTDLRRSMESIHGAVWMAESMTYRFCENCGKMGSIDYGQMWLRCECEECRTDRNAKYEKDETEEEGVVGDPKDVRIANLTKRVRELEGIIGDASMTLADWDGYYDEENFTGNADKLACLIDDAHGIMQNGKSCSLRNEKTLRERLIERKNGGGA